MQTHTHTHHHHHHHTSTNSYPQPAHPTIHTRCACNTATGLANRNHIYIRRSLFKERQHDVFPEALPPPTHPPTPFFSSLSRSLSLCKDTTRNAQCFTWISQIIVNSQLFVLLRTTTEEFQQTSTTERNTEREQNTA